MFEMFLFFPKIQKQKNNYWYVLFIFMYVCVVIDRFGRRPGLLICTFANAVLCVAFGFSPNLFWAVTFRLVSGLFAGNFVVAKSYINDVCDSSNRSTAFSAISLSWGAGSIVGPFLGGLLSRPAHEFPSVFSPSGFFGRFPYALQGMVMGFLILVAGVGTYVYLPETKGRSALPSADTDVQMVSLLEDDAIATQQTDDDVDDDDAAATTTTPSSTSHFPLHDAEELDDFDEAGNNTTLSSLESNTPQVLANLSLKERSKNKKKILIFFS